MRNYITGIAAIIAAALFGWVVMGAVAPNIAIRVEDCKSIESFARDAEAAGNSVLATYRYQEAEACRGKNLDQQGAEDDGEATPTATSSPTTSSPPTTTASPSPSETTANPTASETPSADDGTAVDRVVEFLAARPAVEKISINAFGPKMGLAPDNDGVVLEDMNVEQGVAELKHRLSIDPMLTATTGAEFYETYSASHDLWPVTDIESKTKQFVDDHDAWDKANATIGLIIDAEMDKGEVTVELLPADTYASQWAPVDDSGFPNVAKLTTDRPFDFHVLKIARHKFRLACGLQPYWKVEQAPEMVEIPAPSPGMDRTSDATPVKKTPPVTTTTTPPVTTTTTSTPSSTTTTPPVTTTTTSTPSSTTTTPPVTTTTTPPVTTTTTPPVTPNPKVTTDHPAENGNGPSDQWEPAPPVTDSPSAPGGGQPPAEYIPPAPPAPAPAPAAPEPPPASAPVPSGEPTCDPDICG